MIKCNDGYKSILFLRGERQLKKRIFAAMLAAALTVSAFAFTADAVNTSKNQESYEYDGEVYEHYSGYVGFVELDNSGNIKWLSSGIERSDIYSDGNSAEYIDGVKYDIIKNTLFLNNVSREFSDLYVLAMGKDFKISVEGECVLNSVVFYNDEGLSGTLSIEGRGTLTLNENNFDAYEAAISIYNYKDDGKTPSLTIDENVNLHLYGKEITVFLESNNSKSKNPIVFENGQDIKVAGDFYKIKNPLSLYGYLVTNDDEDENTVWYDELGQRAVKKSDPNGIYAAEKYYFANYEDGEISSGNFVRVRKLIYSEEYKYYFLDSSFGSNGEIDMTVEEFEKSDYQLQEKKVVKDSPDYLYNKKNAVRMGCDVYKDSDGNKYAVFSVGTWFDEDKGVLKNKVFKYSPMKGTDNENIFEPANNISIDSLTKTSETVYGYYIKENSEEYENSLGYKLSRKSDPDGIYAVSKFGHYDDSDKFVTDSYQISKYIYNSEHDIYIHDTTFGNDELFGKISMTPEEFENSEYSYVNSPSLEKDVIRNYGQNHSNGFYNVYKDSSGKQYAVESKLDWYTGEEEITAVYDFKEISGIDGVEESMNGKAYWLTENKKIKPEELQQDFSFEKVESIYQYYVEGTELIYKGKEPSVKKGDVNGDGEVNIADALMISRYDAGLAELDSSKLSVSDVNGDSETDIADALMISRYDAEMIDSI